MDIDEFVAAIRPTVEHDIDAQIAAEPDPEFRRTLKRYRAVIISKQLDVIKIENLRRKLDEAEARLRPHLVEN